jgi:hypothetical protein
MRRLDDRRLKPPRPEEPTGACRIVGEQRLPSGQIDPELDLGGNWLTITDRASPRVCTVPATLTAPLRALDIGSDPQAAGQCPHWDRRWFGLPPCRLLLLALPTQR